MKCDEQVMLKMAMYAAGRALEIVQSGEHGEDQHSGATNQLVLSPIFVGQLLLSVGFLYKSPSRRTVRLSLLPH